MPLDTNYPLPFDSVIYTIQLLTLQQHRPTRDRYGKLFIFWLVKELAELEGRAYWVF
jgi:hypothetical protein